MPNRIFGFFQKNRMGGKDVSDRARKIIYALLPTVCGALTALPFLVGELWFISWFSLTPFIYRVMTRSPLERPGRAYKLGFLFGIGYFGVMYHWFTSFYPMDFAGLNETESVGVIALCWFGLAALHSLELGLVPLFYRLIAPDRKSPIKCLLTFAACWSVFEWGQTLGWHGVPWGRLALSQWKPLPLIQSASLLGGVFVSAIIVAFNFLLVIAYIKYTEHRETKVLSMLNCEEPTEENNTTGKGFCAAIRRVINRTDKVVGRGARVYAIIAVALFLVNLGFGVVRMAVYNETEGTPIKAAAIQGNISSLDKWADNSVSNSTLVHLEMTRKAVEETEAELVLWSETAIPVNIDRHTSYKKMIAETADELNITLIIGAFEYRKNPETGENDEYNALIVFLPDGTELETRYYKRHLVPFAESLPIEGFVRMFFPILTELNLISDPLGQGTEANVFETDIGNIGGIICFDSIFPELSVDAARNGAQLIAVATNDSWFGDSGALHQHNHQSAMRAIETGRYVLRSANTGVSSVITPEGEYLDQLAPLEYGYASADIYMRSEPTLYVIVGDIFAYLCLGFVIVCLGLTARRQFITWVENRRTIDRQ